ncbi:pyridoxal-phosphate-dependent aminotransferase family protein [Dethiothermospora halolimnae]|uniref:pyridoxal-phosphate-dependent aminotransferase family protein n=1 Tax=Dethiothermospora halolimnae TaxID=3114390 RepID=UPI003CCBD37E
MDKMIMTPGPTEINEEVRMAMAKPITNPDLDLEFYEFYKDTTEKVQKLLNTKNDALILSGEGILGLEAACASLIEPGDRVLCIDNGIFGRGFGDFVNMYGGDCEYLSLDYRNPVDISKLEKFLEEDNDFKMATFVHCETPSGILNPAKEISRLLKKHNILTVMDAVSSVGGEPVDVDDWNVDIALGGSQKVLSAPPGITFLTVSDDAWDAMDNREAPIVGMYCNLTIWRGWYDKKWFPYTQPISDIYAFNKALEISLNDGEKYHRHEKIASATRNAIINSGLELYPNGGYSNTLTALCVPKGLDDKKIRKHLVDKYKIMIAGAFAALDGKVLRIGHMGENCREEKVYKTLKYLDKTFREFNVDLKSKIHEEFVKNLD